MAESWRMMWMMRKMVKVERRQTDSFLAPKKPNRATRKVTNPNEGNVKIHVGDHLTEGLLQLGHFGHHFLYVGLFNEPLGCFLSTALIHNEPDTPSHQQQAQGGQQQIG